MELEDYFAGNFGILTGPSAFRLLTIGFGYWGR